MFKPQGWQRSTRLLAVSSVLLLAACGGGGGGDSSGGGSVTYYTVTVSTTGNGSVSPSDPQSVASNGSVTFTATPDAGWKASGLSATGSSSCLSFLTTGPAAGTYTVSNPINDCAFTVNFTRITHTVKAKVVSGVMPLTTPTLAVSGNSDYAVVDASSQYLWVVDADGDHTGGNYDPNLDKLSVYKIGTDGELSFLDSIPTPYVAADCAVGTTSDSLSSYCMVAGPQGSSSDGYVYVRFNGDCSATPCGAPSVHRYHMVNNQIVDAGTWDITPAVSGATLGGVDIIAIDPAGTHFYVGSRQYNLPVTPSSRFVIAAYDVGAGGSLGTVVTAATALSEDVEDVDGLAFYTKNTDQYAYIVFHGTGVIGSQTVSVSGLSYNLVTAQGGFTSITNSSIWDESKFDVSAIAINPQGSEDAYIAYSYPSSGSPSVTDVKVVQAPINADGSLDIDANSLRLNLDGAYIRDMSIDANGGLMFVAYNDVTGAAAGNWDNAHVATYNIEAGGVLSHVSTIDEVVNGGGYVQNVALSADGAQAYLPLTNQGTINQYLIGTTNGTVDPATQNVNEGSTATVTVTSDANYKAVVSDDGCNGAFNETTGEYGIANVTADCTVTATFVAE